MNKKEINKKEEEKDNVLRDENVDIDTENTDKQLDDDVPPMEEQYENIEQSEGGESVESDESVEEDEMLKLENEMKILNDKHLRLIAEYDNYRKRTLKEKIELSKTAGEKIFTGILTLVDDFERALQHIEKSTDMNAVQEGIELIYGKFINFLLQHGVKEIETAGKDFDAEIYEAIAKVPAPSEDKKNTIIDCVEKGYMLDDKVIRYPKVVVGE